MFGIIMNKYFYNPVVNTHTTPTYTRYSMDIYRGNGRTREWIMSLNGDTQSEVLTRTTGMVNNLNSKLTWKNKIKFWWWDFCAEHFN